MTASFFDDKARARNSDPETSHEAAESVENIRESQENVLKAISLGPVCDHELWKRYNEMQLPRMSPSGLRTRRSELVRKGLVVDSGGRALTPSGRRTIIWKAAGAA